MCRVTIFRRRRHRRPVLVLLIAGILLFLLYHFTARFRRPSAPRSLREIIDDTTTPKVVEPEEKELVVASLVGDDTSWLDEFFDTWTKNVYVVNNPVAPLTVAVNKGREAMPFLTYIIDRYDNLPNIAIFIHSLRYQWHNEDPMYDGVPVLKRLHIEHVQKRGYVSLRCTWEMGCPTAFNPSHPSSKTDPFSQAERAYAATFRHFFPGEEIPKTVGAHFSSQFAVSRNRIQARPKEQYEKIRDWLMETSLDDRITGHIMEYTWHILFGMNAVDCQDAGECFCQVFGMCNLTCNQKRCEKRYFMPKHTTMPKGWPDVGPGMDGWPKRDWMDLEVSQEIVTKI